MLGRRKAPTTRTYRFARPAWDATTLDAVRTTAARGREPVSAVPESHEADANPARHFR